MCVCNFHVITYVCMYVCVWGMHFGNIGAFACVIGIEGT